MATKQEDSDQNLVDELFDGPGGGEPAKEETAEKAEPEVDASESRSRDGKGRFAKAETEEPEEEAVTEETVDEVTEPPVEQPQEKQEDHRVPLMELLNEREKRQEEQRRREHIEQQLMAIQRQMQQAQQPEEPIDIFADPQAYQQTVEQRIASMRREMEGNFSLRLARAEHRELFDEAWSEMISRAQSGDDSMRQQVLNSADPGDTLVSLYKQAKIYREANGDLSAYLERQKAEWLKDPQVQAQILEAARQTAGTQAKPQVKLPPSINKAGGSGNQPTRVDASDQGIWDSIN